MVAQDRARLKGQPFDIDEKISEAIAYILGKPEGVQLAPFNFYQVSLKEDFLTFNPELYEGYVTGNKFKLKQINLSLRK